MNYMRKSLLLLLLMSGAVSMHAAISEKYNQGYDLKSLELNTSGNETHLSVYAADQLLYLNDGKVFVSNLTENKDSLLAGQENAALNKLGIQGTVAFDATTNKLYYSLVESETTEWLYVSTLKDGKFTATKRLEIEGMGSTRGNNAFMANAGWSYISKTKSILQNPALAKNGTRLYFTSATIENGKGGKDLWYIDLKEDNLWSAPVNAGDSINTPADEDFAFVEKDELLYFSSNESSVAHLYMAKAAGNAWSKAEQMPEPYNSAQEDNRILVVDGNPFVITNRNVGNGFDIYAFVKNPCNIEIANLQVVQNVNGATYAVSGELVFANAPQVGVVSVKDDSGVAKTFELPLQSPLAFSIDSLECAEDTVQHGIIAWFSDASCETTASYVAPALVKKEFNWVYFLFDFDKSTLTAQSNAEMDALVEAMSQFPDAQFEISGYTDARGSHAYNDKLSERRAETVKKALIEKGIKAENLRIVANGKRALQVPNAKSKEQHAQNRRVEVRIINPETK